MKFGILGLALCLHVTSARAAIADLEKCYQDLGQVEETESGGKKTAIFKNAADVAADCNEKVLAEAKKATDEAEIKALAGVIGRKSNWGSAVPVYQVLAKKNKKSGCVDEDALYSVRDALAHPKDEKLVTRAVEFMETCWPEGKEPFGKMLAGEQNGYTIANLCRFLTAKKAVPARRTNLCKSALKDKR